MLVAEMKFPCPYCRKELDLMELNLEQDLNAIMRTMSTFGAHGHLVMAYCYLFGVTPYRIKAKKYRLLLEEMKRLFDAEAFSFEKRKYNISRQGIAEALDIVVKREFTSTLHNHNYLKQVMIGIAERERTAKSKQAERDLREKERRTLSGIRDGKQEDYCPTENLPADVKAGIEGLKKRLGIDRGK